jgi:hypothetical protein
MSSNWSQIAVLSDDRRGILHTYPLDQHGRHLTQFKRQKRRSIATLSKCLKKPESPEDTLPIDIKGYLNRHGDQTEGISSPTLEKASGDVFSFQPIPPKPEMPSIL